MITGQKGIKYGLEVRKPPGAKAAAPPPKKRSVFGDDDSDEEQQGNVEQQIARQAARKQSDKKVGVDGVLSSRVPVTNVLLLRVPCPAARQPPAWRSAPL